jgi:hypothetical protein
MQYKTVLSFALPARGLVGHVCFLSQSAQIEPESLKEKKHPIAGSASLRSKKHAAEN